MNSKVRQIGNIKLDITDDQKAFILLMHTTPEVKEIIGKVGIKMLLDRLDRDDMQSIKTLHKFTGWMLEWKDEEEEEERVPTSEARTETDLEYAERISAWNMRGMENEEVG